MLCVFSVYLFAKRFEHPSYIYIYNVSHHVHLNRNNTLSDFLQLLISVNILFITLYSFSILT